MYDKRQWSEDELIKALEVLNAIVELTMDEYNEYKKTENLGKYFMILWVMKYRWDQRFIDVYGRLKHIFLTKKTYDIAINESIKSHEIENKKNDFCTKTQTPPKNVVYYILRDMDLKDDNVLILGIPYTKFENWENKRKFGWTVEVPRSKCPNLYKRMKISHEVFNEELF